MAQSSFDFDSISTPADLAKSNDEVQSPLSQAMDAMGEVGFQGSMLMVCWLLNNMAEFHHDFAVDKAEGRKQVAAWAHDEGKIDAALAILRTIDIGLPRNDDEDKSETADA